MLSRRLKSLVITLLVGVPFSMFSQIVADFEANIKQGCIPLQVIYTNKSTNNGATIDKSKYIFSWKMDESQNTDKLKDTVKAMYVNAGKKTVTLTILNLDGTPVSGSSSSKTISNLITVFPNPSVEAIADKTTVCRIDSTYNPRIHDSEIHFSPKNLTTNGAPIVSYMWDFGDGSNYDFNANATHAYSVRALYYATVYATDTNGCKSTKATSRSVAINVSSDRPTANFKVDNDRTCNPSLTAAFTNSSTAPTNRKLVGYKWEIIEGSTSSIDTNKNITKTFLRKTDVDVKMISLIAYADNGCWSIPKDTTVILYKLDPHITVADNWKILNKNQACAGLVTFSTAYQAYTTYDWTVGTTKNYSNGFSTTLAPGSYPVKLIATNPACSKTIDTVIVVEQLPAIVVSPTGSFNCGKTKTVPFSIAASAATIQSSRWYINSDTAAFGVSVGTAGPSHTFSASAAYDITVKTTTINGCKDTKTFGQSIQVYYPDVSFTLDKNRQCVPFDILFTNTSTYTFPGMTSNPDFISAVTWNFGDASPKSSNPNTVTHSYTVDGKYSASINIKTDKGCDITIAHDVLAGKKPVINIDFKLKEVCAGYDILKDPLRSGVSFIDSSKVVDSTEFSFLHINDGKRGASNQVNKVIVTGDKSHAYFNNSNQNDTGMYYLKITDFYHGCRTDSSLIVPKDLIRVLGPIVYHDGSTINCADPFKVEIKADTIRSATSWDFKLYKDATPSIYLSTINSPTKKSTIDFEPYGYGTGSYTSIIHAYNTTTNCLDSSWTSFIITKPKAVLSIPDTTPCLNATQLLSDVGLNDIGYITSHEWSLKYPDGTIDATDDYQTGGPHRHKSPEFDTFSHLLFHRSVPDGNIVFETLSLNQKGINQLYYKITDLNNCTDDTTFTFRVYQPTANFTVPPITDCLPITVPFTDASTKYFSTIVSREWTTGGDTAQFLTGNRLKVSDIYHDDKMYTVSLKVTDSLGCTNTYTNPNGVKPFVPPAKIIPVGKICLIDNKALATFHVDSLMGNQYTATVDSFRWDFGDGATLVTNWFTAKHTYTSEITNPKVKVTAYKTAPSTNVCKSLDSNYTTDIKDARANFSFVDASGNPDSCRYAFIKVNTAYASRYTFLQWQETYKETKETKYKGGISTANFTFYGFGDHVIRLVSNSDYEGCKTDTAEMIHTIPSSKFEITNDKSDVCIKEVINFGLKDTLNLARYKHTWTFGGETDTVNFNVSHAFDNVYDGTAQVSFVVNNGCNSYDDTVITLQRVMADFDRGLNDKTTIGCIPYSVSLLNKSQGALSYAWDFGDGTTDITTSPIHSFTNADTKVNVTLSIKGAKCNDAITKTITTYKTPEIPPFDTLICEGAIVNKTLKPGIGTVITSWKTDSSIVSLSSDNLTAVLKPDKTTKYIISGKYVTVNTGDSPCIGDTAITIRVQQRPEYKGAPNNFLIYMPYNKPNQILLTKPKNELFTFTTYGLNNTDTLTNVTYKWTPSTWLSCDNCPNPTITVGEDKDLTYIVTMSDANNCFVIDDTLQFKVIVETEVGLPSAFTPNKDGSNDLVIPRGWGVKEFLEINIYNRWGQLVYKTNEITKGWDGNFNGRPQDPDTYAWTIRFKDSKDVVQEKKGYITLLR